MDNENTIMPDSKIVGVVIVGIMLVVSALAIGYLFPSTAGTVANMTSLNNACQNCDSGVKSFGSNIPIILISSAVVFLGLIIVWAVKTQ